MLTMDTGLFPTTHSSSPLGCLIGILNLKVRDGFPHIPVLAPILFRFSLCQVTIPFLHHLGKMLNSSFSHPKSNMSVNDAILNSDLITSMFAGTRRHHLPRWQPPDQTCPCHLHSTQHLSTWQPGDPVTCISDHETSLPKPPEATWLSAS